MPSMLVSVNGDGTRPYYFVNGRRVTRERYFEVNNQHRVHECFHTTERTSQDGGFDGYRHRHETRD